MKKLIMILAILSAAPVSGNYYDVYAVVVRVEQIPHTRQIDGYSSECLSSKPGNTSFLALIEWDIGCEQPRTVESIAYRVTYRYGGQTFVTTMDSPPGDTIPVRVSFR